MKRFIFDHKFIKDFRIEIIAFSYGGATAQMINTNLIPENWKLYLETEFDIHPSIANSIPYPDKPEIVHSLNY